MKLIKFTSVLLCFIMAAAVFMGCASIEESEKSAGGDANVSDAVSEQEQNKEESSKINEVVGITDTTPKGTYFSTALDFFYHDDTYAYCFSSTPKHEYIIVEYADGTTQNVKEALAEGNITLDDLDDFGIKYGKQSILEMEENLENRQDQIDNNSNE